MSMRLNSSGLPSLNLTLSRYCTNELALCLMGTQGEQGEQGDAETSMPTTANPYALGESILSPPGVTVSKITHYLPLCGNGD